MRFITLVKTADNSGPPPEGFMEAMGRLAEEFTRKGVLVETGGLTPTGTHVRLSRGKLSVTDGPFTETKEVVGGYAVLEVQSKEEAIEATRRFMQLHQEHWPGWEGETEIREVFG